MKNKIRTISDAIFSFVLFMTVFFSIAHGKIEKNYLLLFCLILTFLCQSIYLKASNDDYAFSKEKTNLYNYFVYTKVNATAYFYDALKTRYEVENNGEFLTIGKYNVFVNLSFSPLTLGSVINAFKNRTRDHLVFICFDCDKQARNLCMRLPAYVHIWQKNEVYSLLNALNAIPVHDFSFSKKNNLSHLFSSQNAPKLSKSFIFSACIILLFSFFSPFKAYYRIFTAFLLILTVVLPLVRLIIKRKNRISR